MDHQETSTSQLLKEARERANWSVSRVAFALNLPSFVIVALEEGQYSRLHGDTFVIGYLRSYAELFGLDSNALVASYKARAREMALPVADVAEHAPSRLPPISGYRAGYGIAAAVTLVAALSLLSPDAVKVDQPESQGIVVDTSVGTTLIDSMDALPAENPTQDLLPSVVVEQSVDPEQVKQQLRDRIRGEPSATAASVSESSLLSFRFSADCWVEVRDGDGKVIFASLQKAQERIELSGKPPFHVTLGYAPGVEVSYNGQPVTIDSHRDTVARLVLGNS
jgi:cytoskeleton protein RodZ